jgi:hypothetical protein
MLERGAREVPAHASKADDAEPRGLARRQKRLAVDRMTPLDLSVALELGVTATPSRMVALPIHSQTRRTITPATLPYVALKDPKLAT